MATTVSNVRIVDHIEQVGVEIGNVQDMYTDEDFTATGSEDLVEYYELCLRQMADRLTFLRQRMTEQRQAPADTNNITKFHPKPNETQKAANDAGAPITYIHSRYRFR